jgi:DNA topoisomerase I
MRRAHRLTEVDPKKTASNAKLIYVSDKEPGIKRVRHGKTFRYVYDNNKPVSKDDLTRIKRLVIPPAWSEVWICVAANGHIQCTGYDARKRKQYKYHAEWIEARSETKFFRMIQFGEALPVIRLQVEKDLSSRELSSDKVLASVVRLMEQTYIRIGNSSYEKMYGSYGLTTLKDQHVKISGATIEFCFKGKKGVLHKITIKNRRLAKIVKQCRDIPGKELFQYKDSDGNFHSIDSGMVNSYIRNAAGENFTAKDFRTWAGTLNAMRTLYNLGPASSLAEAKRNITQTIDTVSKLLGNTRTVCKKYYINPLLLECYEEGKIAMYFDELKKIMKKDSGDPGLLCEEKVLMKMLQRENKRTIK